MNDPQKNQIRRLQFTLDFQEDLKAFLEKKHPEVVDYRILSKSLDARNANRGRRPKYQYNLQVLHQGEKFQQTKEEFEKIFSLKGRPIIIGAGPAGLFCALRFAEYGIPCTLLERGERAHKRMINISKFWRYGQFDPENNVCYGEGGAGLFSDGKLITRIKSPYVQWVMDRFVDFGAPADTAYVSNPHLGSNKIRGLIGKMTDYLREMGCDIHYNTRVDELLFEDNKVSGVKTSKGETFEASHVVLAVGHSAKEMYAHLKDHQVQMKAKDFAVGVRVEHPRRLIDEIQHGQFCESDELGAARYRLAWENPESKKGTYSFCMCPGGYVLSSGTEADGIVVNGMSNFARNSPWSNAALVVSVKADVDFSTEDVLNGLEFQRSIETKAYELSCNHASGKEIPSQSLKDFMDGKASKVLPKTSCPSGIFSQNLHELLPDFISKHLRFALEQFDKRMSGFISDQALFLAPETRTSAPVTIERDRDTLESLSHENLYPCGEGAGYAGGITSAAVDGVKVAESIISKCKS